MAPVRLNLVRHNLTNACDSNSLFCYFDLAGKTTTMGILTAEFPPTSGDALLATYSVTSKPEETRKRTGYCPQFDAHFNNMTGFEHVKLYAAIKGLSKDVIDEAVNGKLTEVGLSEVDRHRLSNKYSGGMKRKLSVACATIADPEVSLREVLRFDHTYIKIYIYFNCTEHKITDYRLDCFPRRAFHGYGSCFST